MELPFLTLSKYDGQRLQPLRSAAATGGGHNHAWRDDESEEVSPLIFQKVANLLAAKGEEVLGKARLAYVDKKGFGNQIYRIDSRKPGGETRQYFLKVLGTKTYGTEENRREVFVWKALGFGANGKLPPGEWTRGLPPEVHTFEPFNAVLLPYYTGRLSALPGRCYEFPLVLTLLMYLDCTLRKLHQMGLVYMDLCPENVLYMEKGLDQPMSFFLTDMGSVKMCTGFPGSDTWSKLKDLVSARRMTQDSTRPPESRFPLEADPATERPAYDFHTLARTAAVLLGLGGDAEIPSAVQQHWSPDFTLEAPLAPRQSEMQAMMNLLTPMLAGEPLDQQAAEELFWQFFENRAAFTGTRLPPGPIREHWTQMINARLNRYRTALEKQRKEALMSTIEQHLDKTPKSDLDEGLNRLEQLPRQLREEDWSAARDTLLALGQSGLSDLGPTVRYALDYHRRLFKRLVRGNPALIEGLETLNRGIPALDRPPEKDTLQALRGRRQPSWGMLYRSLTQIPVAEVVT